MLAQTKLHAEQVQTYDDLYRQNMQSWLDHWLDSLSQARCWHSIRTGSAEERSMTTDMPEFRTQKLSSLHTYSTAHLAGTHTLSSIDSKSCLMHIDRHLVKQMSQACSRNSGAEESCSNKTMSVMHRLQTGACHAEA